MALQVQQVPYEFLVRWAHDEAGVITLAGAHVKLLTVVKDGDRVSSVEGEAQPVDVGQGTGFPLADVLDQMHVDAMAKMSQLEASLRERSAEVQELKAQMEARTAEVQKLTAEFERVSRLLGPQQQEAGSGVVA